jgi:cytochrome c553
VCDFGRAGLLAVGWTDDAHQTELKATQDQLRRAHAEQAAETVTRLLEEEVDRRISAWYASLLITDPYRTL